MPCLQTEIQPHVFSVLGGMLATWPWDFPSQGPGMPWRWPQLQTDILLWCGAMDCDEGGVSSSLLDSCWVRLPKSVWTHPHSWSLFPFYTSWNSHLHPANPHHRILLPGSYKDHSRIFSHLWFTFPRCFFLITSEDSISWVHFQRRTTCEIKEGRGHIFPGD